jgi:hypothetical protein
MKKVLDNIYFGVHCNFKHERTVMLHSNIVGGSTAKRVINCPGSVALVQKMPPKPSNEHADRGTLLHNVIAEHLEGKPITLGVKYNDQVLTQELVDEKLTPALKALDEVDPTQNMVYEVETRVGFGDLLPGVFGSTDLIGRVGSRAVVLDWKFGDGVMVDAVENPQLMFYAAAAMRTDEAKWAFDGADEVECIIVQPPMIRRWVTTKERIAAFELELVSAVKQAQQPNAKLMAGDHCRWCNAKPICPVMNGAVDRALKTTLDGIDTVTMSQMLQSADLLEQWLKDIRGLAHQVLEKGGKVPGYKLVAKRSTRQWADEAAVAKSPLFLGLPIYEPKLISPAQAEKLLKKEGKELPKELVVSISSGNTMASEDDPRPAVVLIGQQLTAALNKIV